MNSGKQQISLLVDLQDLEVQLRSEIPSSVLQVSEITQYVMGHGGKRIRPVLTLLSAQLQAGEPKGLKDVAVAMEYLHTASLLHDDVLDHAQVRRGQDTANKKWGNHLSVLGGDYFYCRAMDLLVRTGRLDILRCVTDAVTKTTEGQVQEISQTRNLDLSENDYLAIIEAKTAQLMGAACKSGLMLVSDDSTSLASAWALGINLGIAFQIMDDYLDYAAEAPLWGKTIGTDLREGKLTWPLIWALKNANDKDRHFLRATMEQADCADASLDRVIEIMNEVGALENTREKAAQYVHKAKEALQSFKDSPARQALQNLASYVLERGV